MRASYATAQVRGHVSAERGSPLANVEVWSYGEDVRTDKAGNFTLSMAKNRTRDEMHVVRVFAPGYRPLTKIVRNPSNVAFSLQRDPAAVWKAPWCSDPARRFGVLLPNTKTAMYGPRIRFLVPPGTEIKTDIDIFGSVVCRGKDCLGHVFGGMPEDAISQIATLDLFSGVKEMRERNVYDAPLAAALGDIAFIAGAEYRGRRDDGTYLRRVGVDGERIGYDGVTKASADFFDRIIDSFCWLRDLPE
jgi:hypothetical protein